MFDLCMGPGQLVHHGHHDEWIDSAAQAIAVGKCLQRCQRTRQRQGGLGQVARRMVRQRRALLRRKVDVIRRRDDVHAIRPHHQPRREVPWIGDVKQPDEIVVAEHDLGTTNNPGAENVQGRSRILFLVRFVRFLPDGAHAGKVVWEV